MDKITEQILQRRMNGLYLSRKCGDIVQLSRELLGLHCWFHRNVAFSALIRGADITGWKNALTKTWLYRGTLHGVVYDELPQLLNVLRGEMSLVGPRPIVEAEVERYEEYIQDYYIVKPGITGLWQVSGRNDIDYPERVRMDSWYVRNWSVWLDLILLAKTIGVVAARKGAY